MNMQIIDTNKNQGNDRTNIWTLANFTIEYLIFFLLYKVPNFLNVRGILKSQIKYAELGTNAAK